MPFSNTLTCVGLLMLSVMSAVAQSGGQPPTYKADPRISAALSNISAERIKANVEKLVSFQNRSTLTADIPASSGRGIVAAREWILSEFERYSKECGG